MTDLPMMNDVDMLCIFDEAYAAIAHLIETDSLRRFCSTKGVRFGESTSRPTLKSSTMLAQDQ